MQKEIYAIMIAESKRATIRQLSDIGRNRLKRCLSHEKSRSGYFPILGLEIALSGRFGSN